MEDEVEKAYTEMNAARDEVEALRMVNAYSLDTPQKQFEWDVRYKKATDRLDAAMAARDRLVRLRDSPPREA